MNQSLGHQSARYLVIGGIVYAVDFGLYALMLSGLGAGYLVANAVGKAGGAALGFVLHKHVTFSWAQKDHPARQAAAYLALFLANLALANALLWLLAGAAGMAALIAKPLTDAVVIAVSFLAGRAWVYRPA